VNNVAVNFSGNISGVPGKVLFAIKQNLSTKLFFLYSWNNVQLTDTSFKLITVRRKPPTQKKCPNSSGYWPRTYNY